MVARGFLGPVGVLAVLCSLALPSTARAASFTVNPTQINLTAGSTSALLTLKNESAETLRFQLTVVKWDQSADGEMEMTPSEDIVFFPKLVILASHEERKVRVGTSVAFGPNEKTYRIFIEELPPADSAPSVAGVRMRTRMGIPIFLQPAKSAVSAAVDSLALNGGRVTVRVQNKGNAHFITDSVKVSGTNAQGVLVFNKVVNGWYILSGRSQLFAIPLSAAECAAAVTVDAEVKVGGSTMKSQVQKSAQGCTATAGKP
jgi:fimbrial chaperone protein